jgi:hypothetical protein
MVITTSHSSSAPDHQMKYLCLIYDAESTIDAMSEAEGAAFMGEYDDFSKELGASGRMIDGQELAPVRTATTVRIRNGVLSTTDGPFAETKEQLGGYFLVDAADLDEAIRIASRIPSARIGSIEVRPIMVRG